MELTLLLNYRGIESKSYQGKAYYRYYFENQNGVSISFSYDQDLKLERGKNYNVTFNVAKLYFKGFANGK